jgi:putative tryptophan/tyrosine transport system substrate-binding protein
MPNAAVIGQLVNPGDSQLAEAETREVRDAARAFGLHLQILNASVESEITAAFTTLDQLRADALLVGADPFFMSRREQIVAEAARHSIAAMYFTREYPAAGGLMSYGGNLTDTYHQAGIYAGRILKGQKPADLPIQQLTKGTVGTQPEDRERAPSRVHFVAGVGGGQQKREIGQRFNEMFVRGHSSKFRQACLPAPTR